MEQALLGPLSGSDVSLHTVSSYGQSAALYSAKTSIGSDIYTAGIINMDKEFKEALDDDELYIFTVSGGYDIDADDDFVADTYATQNNGVIHALLTGKEIKEVGFKVNILTEIAYQMTKDMLGVDANKSLILEKLDDVATRLKVS